MRVRCLDRVRREQHWRDGLRRRAGAPVQATIAPRHETQLAVVGLDDGRAAFHPVAAVEVVDARERAVGGVMDMPADHAVDATPPGLGGDRLLEGADEGDGALNPILEIGGKRPEPEAQMAAHPVQRLVEPERELVAVVAQIGQPARRAHDDVELVAVHHQVAPALRRLVHDVGADLDAAEAKAGVVAQPLVVVAGDQHDARALAGAANELLDDVVVGLRPVRAAPHLPEVDDVADEVDGVGLAMPEEIEERLGLGGARAEVDVGDEQRTNARRQCRSSGRSGERARHGRQQPDSHCSRVTRVSGAGLDRRNIGAGLRAPSQSHLVNPWALLAVAGLEGGDLAGALQRQGDLVEAFEQGLPARGLHGKRAALARGRCDLHLLQID